MLGGLALPCLLMALPLMAASSGGFRPSRLRSLPGECTPTVGGEAFEILSLGNCTVYLAEVEGRTDVTKELFDSWDIPAPWSKNSAGVRYTTFEKSCLYSSPGTTALETTGIVASEPWPNGPVKWTYLANSCPSDLVLGGCFPEACDVADARPGSLKYYHISKCHKMVWAAGKPVATIVDPEGNGYLMHATTTREAAQAGVAAGNAALPEGWVRGTVTFDTKFVLTPSPEDSSAGEVKGGARKEFGDYACGFTLIQDAEGNAYHRYITTTGDVNIKGELSLILDGLTFPEFTAQLFSNVFIAACVAFSVVLCGSVGACWRLKKLHFNPSFNKGFFAENSGYKTLARVGGVACLLVQVIDLFVHIRVNDVTWAHALANVSLVVCIFGTFVARMLAQRKRIKRSVDEPAPAYPFIVHAGTAVGALLYLVFIICFFAFFGLTNEETGESRVGIFIFIVASVVSLAIINAGAMLHVKKLKETFVGANQGNNAESAVIAAPEEVAVVEEVRQ